MATKSQTKEEQAKKKLEFNQHRVDWFDAYMKDELPFLYQMHISPKRDDLLSNKEQLSLATLIQAGIAGKILQAWISNEDGNGESVHLQKTIITEYDQIVELLERSGWTPEKFAQGTKNRRRLDKLVADAEEGRNIFAEKNLGLVTMVAGRRKSNAGAVDFDDLVAEGMGGLMVAIDHFNPAMGNMFSTPGAWWIDQPIRNYLDAKTKTIHMPTHMNNIYKSIYYATRALRDKYADDSYITDEMIAEYCQSKGRDITVEKIQEARKLRRETISYDAPLGDGGANEKTLAELIEAEDDIESDVVMAIGGKENFDKMLALVADDKKREILRDWYTTDETQDIVILSNVSRKHCLTKERVRQLKAEAENELHSKISALAKQHGIAIGEIFAAI